MNIEDLNNELSAAKETIKKLENDIKELKKNNIIILNIDNDRIFRAVNWITCEDNSDRAKEIADGLIQYMNSKEFEINILKEDNKRILRAVARGEDLYNKLFKDLDNEKV